MKLRYIALSLVLTAACSGSKLAERRDPNVLVEMFLGTPRSRRGA